MLIAQPEDLTILSTNMDSCPGNLSSKSLLRQSVQFINEYHRIETFAKMAERGVLLGNGLGPSLLHQTFLTWKPLL